MNMMNNVHQKQPELVTHITDIYEDAAKQPRDPCISPVEVSSKIGLKDKTQSITEVQRAEGKTIRKAFKGIHIHKAKSVQKVHRQGKA